MENKTKLKSAIIGCGGIAQVHAGVLSELESCQFVACADIKFERAEKMAAKYNLHAYSSMEELLEKEEIDVVHLCTPHYLHTPMAELAAKKGVMVFSEKPPVISCEQWSKWEEITKLTKVGVCFQNRYNKTTKYIKELINSPEAGKILGCRAFVTWQRGVSYYVDSGWRGSLETEGGGALINQSIHTLDLMLEFLGRPTEVEAMCRNHHLKGVIEVEDAIEAYFKCGDAMGIFYATTAYCTDSPVIIEVVCENLTVKMDGSHISVKYANGDRSEIDMLEAPAKGKSYWGSGHKGAIGDFYDNMLQGKEPPINMESIRNTVDTMLAIYKSARETKDIVKI